jgi:hypothetical protein
MVLSLLHRTFMLQDIMRFDHDVDEAVARIGAAERTCAIWIGLGQCLLIDDGKPSVWIFLILFLSCACFPSLCPSAGQGARPNPHAGEPRATANLPADFKLVASSWEQLHVYNPENFPSYPPAHPYFPDLVFVNKHVQPSRETCMGDLMEWGYGSFEAMDFFQTVTALEQTGDMHIAVTGRWNAQNA